MKYSKQEILQYVNKEDVEFIGLIFYDVFGKQKSMPIMPEEFPHAFEDGIAIDASTITGSGDETHPDLLLHPDTDTSMPLPWGPERGWVVRLFCSMSHPDGRAFECDICSILKKATQAADKTGIHFYFSAEQEFCFFTVNETGEATKSPYGNAEYMDTAPDDRNENIRHEICPTLERMDIHSERSHHEQGPGWNEVDPHYLDPLTAADDAMTFQTVIRTAVECSGLIANFSPRPLADKPGNGFHTNISAKADDSSDYLY